MTPAAVDAPYTLRSIEAMLGLNPRAPSGDPLAALFDGDDWVITFTVPDTTPIDLLSSIEVSTDLETDWTTAAESMLDVWTAHFPATLTTAPANPGFTFITLRLPATDSRLYARFVAIQP